jgi:hypothetical protein
MMLRSANSESFSDAWYPRAVWIYLPGDIDFDGKVTRDEAKRVESYVRKKQRLEPGWDKVCDMDEDDDVDELDVEAMYRKAGGR